MIFVFDKFKNTLIKLLSKCRLLFWAVGLLEYPQGIT
jgi:hypothetical protein